MESTHLSEVLSRLPDGVEFLSLQGRRLVLRMTAQMGTAERGHMLLDLEKRLKREVDPAIEVFLQPMVDQNAMRVKLRGVKVGEHDSSD